MNAQGHDDEVPPDDDAVGGLSYMEASRELDGIVEFFEKSEVDVDQLVARLERATAIVDELDRRIRRTRAQVEELVPKLEAAGRSASAETSVGDGAVGANAEGTDDGASDGDTLPF
jgi:exodeoxyribonuclease VII small subunit